MSLKSRIEKLEGRASGEGHMQFIEWDRERLTDADAALVKGTDRGKDKQSIIVIGGSDEHKLFQSVLDKHSDVLGQDNNRLGVRLIVLTSPDLDEDGNAIP